MKDEDIYKLETAIQLIRDVLDHDATNTAILVTWLSVAGVYCRDVAEGLNE